MSDPKKFVFSIEALNDVLSQTKSIKKKLNPFIARFQQYEMSEIYQTFDYLHQCMAKPKSQLKYKFNSLFVLKVLFDTSNFVLVNWIEVFFLPHILEIAKFSIIGQNNGKDYFLKQGYTAADEPEVQKFGFNYTLLATELLQVAALVKPFKLFESEFIQTRSDFALAFDELKKAGFKQPEKLSIYAKPQVVEGQVAKYEQGLAQISQSIDQFLDVCGEFSNSKLEEYLRTRHDAEKEKYQISIIQLYESGDLYLSSSAIEICKAEISEPISLLTFQNTLNVLHRLMLAGDYECFYVLNFQDGLNKALTEVIQIDKTERGLRRGEKFFSQFNNPEESLRVYALLLDYVQKWALFASGFIKEDQNVLKKVVTTLSETAKLQFPHPSNLESEKKKFQTCFSRNKERNKRLTQEIEQAPSALANVLTQISQPASKPVQSNSEIKASNKKEPSPITTSTKLEANSTPMPPSQKSSKDLPFVQQLDLVQEVYENFLDDSANYDKNKVILEKFLANFQNDLGTIPDEVFDQVYERAANLQMDVQEVLKKAPVQKSLKKQEPLKPETHKSIAQVVQNQSKGTTKKIESETIIEQKPEPQKKSLARMQPMKESRKINNQIEDTPVKKFEMEDSQRNHVMNENEKLGYNNNKKIESHQELKEKAPVVSHKEVKIGYEEQNIGTNISTKKVVTTSKNVVSSNNLGLGYDEPQKELEYIHPSTHGYKQDQQKVQSKAEIQRQVSVKHQEPPKQSPSHKVIRKTEDLSHSRKDISNSRKNIEESSIKSNSKVEHFSPESSQFSQPQHKEYENSNFKKKPFESEEIEIPLEEFEENLCINKPKEFKSLTGQAREIKQKTASKLMTPEKKPEQLELRSREDVHEREPSEHHVSPLNLEGSEKHNLQNLGFSSQQLHIPAVISPKNMPNSHSDLQEELQEEQLILEEDQINPPNINPLEESFHDIGELEQKIKQKLNSNGNAASSELSFKNCFQTDKYILQRQEDKKTKMYWLENETTNLVKNIIVKKQKSRVSKINVPQILDERNKKYQQELKIVEEEKNKKIKELQKKIKNLEKESEFFKQQAAQHAEQIKTLKANSDFDKESVGQKGYLKDVENIAVHKLSSPQRFSYSNVKALHFDASNFKETMYLDPKGKLINSKRYKSYFSQFTKEKEKKLMLKSKDLLYKDKQIEIGFMSKKDNDRLIVTLYITPEKDIESLSWTVQHESALNVESEPNSFITYVRTKKQQKIFFTIQPNNPGFTLPVVQFTYTAAEQNHTVRVVLPCAFHKFLHIKETDNDLNDFFKKNESIVRGEEVPYSKRLLKSLDNLKEYFQSMSVLNKGLPNEQGEISYGGMAVYKGFQFPVRISVKPNHFLYVQAIVKPSADEAQTEMTIVEYFISTVTHLLMKEIQ